MRMSYSYNPRRPCLTILEINYRGWRYTIVKKNLTFGIIVKDYDEAIDFYTRKLGFVVAEDADMGEDRWVTITRPGNQDCVIALHKALQRDDLALIGKQGGSFPYMGLDTEDCIGEYQRMKALGVKFHGEPDVRPYGTGVMLEDLYGNRIFMNQEPGDTDNEQE